MVPTKAYNKSNRKSNEDGRPEIKGLQPSCQNPNTIRWNNDKVKLHNSKAEKISMSRKFYHTVGIADTG